MNHADLSPNYSGFLMSITNTIASIPGFVAPLLTGIITEDNVSLSINLIELPGMYVTQFLIIVNNCCMENNIPDCRRVLHYSLHHIYTLWKGRSTTI